MEFDTNTGPANDEQRRLAETKKLTLKPLHMDITPEAPSDSEVATRHIIEPAISNASNDIEQDTAPIQPSAATLATPATIPHARARPIRKITIAAVILCGLGIALYFIVTN